MTQHSPTPTQAPHPDVIIVSGLSGAGKSTVLQVFEDLHFFTADGIPPALVPDLFSMLQRPEMEHFRGMALGMDFKSSQGGSFVSTDSLNHAMAALRAYGARPQLLFLEAAPQVLLRRYASTRRPHPWESEGMGLEQALQEQIRRLQPLRTNADMILDTSSYNLHDLRREIQRRWSSSKKFSHAMRVNIQSFGFKYGIPNDADLVFDVRFLPNPYFDEALRPMCGLDKEISSYVFGSPIANDFVAHLLSFLNFLLPQYDAEGRYRLSLALGCTGGRHRSVAVAEAVAQALRQSGFSISVEHCHISL